MASQILFEDKFNDTAGTNIISRPASVGTWMTSYDYSVYYPAIVTTGTGLAKPDSYTDTALGFSELVTMGEGPIEIMFTVASQALYSDGCTYTLNLYDDIQRPNYNQPDVRLYVQTGYINGALGTMVNSVHFTSLSSFGMTQTYGNTKEVPAVTGTHYEVKLVISETKDEIYLDNVLVVSRTNAKLASKLTGQKRVGIGLGNSAQTNYIQMVQGTAEKQTFWTDMVGVGESE